MAKRLYFAYGSNMIETQMAFRCRDATTLGVARLCKHRFIINARGVASITQTQGAVVYGLLWKISEADEKQLDRYEGVGTGHYLKSVLPVAVDENETVDALVYVASSDEHGKPRPGYMENVFRAAKDLGFPTQVLEELKTWLKTEAQST